MRKILFLIICLLSFIGIVKADYEEFVWYNDPNMVYTTNYSGGFSGKASGSYESGTISINGNYNITLNNFNTIAVMSYKPFSITLKGTSTMDAFEQSSNSPITLTGNGTLKVKSIGLGMEDMISSSTPNYESAVTKYVKGDYKLSVSGGYLVFEVKETITTTTTKKETTTSQRQTTKSTKASTKTNKTTTNKTTTTSTTTSKLDNEESTTTKMITTTEIQKEKEENKSNTLIYVIAGTAIAAAVAIFVGIKFIKK